MPDIILNIDTIRAIIAPIASKYGVESIYVFGSYARGEATTDSDIDFLVFGGDTFKRSHVFALAEEVRKALGKNIDMFEISEINTDSSFYDTIMREKVLVA